MNRVPQDAWNVLGIAPGSPEEMVRAQYLRLVRINHPDQFATNPAEQARHEEIMKQVTWAYQEIIQGRAQVPKTTTPKAPPPPRYSAPRVRRPVDVRELQCRTHHRWAVVYCTVCGTPLCSRCDESLSGYCSAHRRRSWF